LIVQAYNEPLVAVMVGMLLSVSAGFRITLPLLAVNLLAFEHVIALPENVAWLGTEPTLILLTVAALMETLVHFVPAAGTYLKAAATPLAFVAGTLLMAVPLGDRNPLYQWTLALVIGGGTATLTHLGVTGARALTGPVNVASLGTFGILWNLGELLCSIVMAALGWLCLVAGWIVGAIALVAMAGLLVYIAVQGMMRFRRVPAATT
jgi:hypothetical protein